MNAARTTAAKPSALADPVEVFTARAEARAYLWSEGELDLHEAVDKLQLDAERSGLVELIGQDRVQALLASAFRAVRGRAAIAIVPDPKPISEIIEAPKRGVVAEATLMAAEYLVREGDTDRLRKLLASHSAAERAAIRKHLEAKACRR